MKNEMRHGDNAYNIGCTLRNSLYHVQFNSSGANQSTAITSLAKQDLASIMPDNDLSGGYEDRKVTWSANHHAFGGYWFAISGMLNNRLVCKEPTTESFLAKSVLMSCPELGQIHSVLYNYLNQSHKIAQDSQPELCRNKTVIRAIEDLSHNLTLSLLVAIVVCKYVRHCERTDSSQQIFIQQAIPVVDIRPRCGRRFRLPLCSRMVYQSQWLRCQPGILKHLVHDEE